MPKTVLFTTVLILFCAITAIAQYDYSASQANPFGQLNPNASAAVADYAKLIGTCDCQSISRNPDGTWADPVDMIWTFKYIMNGMGVQDETLKADGGHSGSIRLYQPDSAKWYVHYYSTSTPGGQLSAWEGGMQDEEIILYNRQAAPNGTDGYYKIRFYDISSDGFNWLGVWTDLSESFVYETWKIECKKRMIK